MVGFPSLSAAPAMRTGETRGLGVRSRSRVSPAPPIAVLNPWQGRSVHLVGIGGSGMSGLAKILQARGCRVSGSDSRETSTTRALHNQGVSIRLGHSLENLPEHLDLVVASAAVPDNAGELRGAREAGVRVLKYAQMLGCLMRGSIGVAVSGCHGKTTTTSMIACVLYAMGKDPSVVVGGTVPQLGGSARAGTGRHFVVEACEYDHSFWNLHPMAGVIANVDMDHADYFANLEEIVEAFAGFAERVKPGGIMVVNGQDQNALRAAAHVRKGVRLETAGFSETCDWRATNMRRDADGQCFDVYYHGDMVGEFELRMPGAHNIRNALSTIAVCRFLGCGVSGIQNGLADFQGARRRFEKIGDVRGVLVIDDFAHHPTEVRATLKATRAQYPARRVWCVFQPHQYSRTRIFLDEFGASFGGVDRVIIPDIFAARDSDWDRQSVHARNLVDSVRQDGVEAEYIPELEAVAKKLTRETRPGDVVLTMGAGTVNQVAEMLVKNLSEMEETFNESRTEWTADATESVPRVSAHLVAT